MNHAWPSASGEEPEDVSVRLEYSITYTDWVKYGLSLIAHAKDYEYTFSHLPIQWGPAGHNGEFILVVTFPSAQARQQYEQRYPLNVLSGSAPTPHADIVGQDDSPLRCMWSIPPEEWQKPELREKFFDILDSSRFTVQHTPGQDTILRVKFPSAAPALRFERYTDRFKLLGTTE